MTEQHERLSTLDQLRRFYRDLVREFGPYKQWLYVTVPEEMPNRRFHQWCEDYGRPLELLEESGAWLDVGNAAYHPYQPAAQPPAPVSFHRGTGRPGGSMKTISRRSSSEAR